MRYDILLLYYIDTTTVDIHEGTDLLPGKHLATYAERIRSHRVAQANEHLEATESSVLRAPVKVGGVRAMVLVDNAAERSVISQALVSQVSAHVTPKAACVDRAGKLFLWRELRNWRPSVVPGRTHSWLLW